MPALILTTSLAADRTAPGRCRALAELAAAPLRTEQRSWTPHVETEDVYLGSVNRRNGTPERVQTWSSATLTVIMEGYLSQELPDGRHPSNDAELVGELYQQRGPAAIDELDGSYVIIVICPPDGKVTLWTDRPATRASFMAVIDDVLLVAPELKCFHKLPGANCAIAPGSLAAMAMNGALMDENTYYRGVQFLGPARRVTVGLSGIDVTRYWHRRIGGDPPGAAPSPDEVADCIIDATRRHVSRFERPVLALSGGLDSRLIQAACRRLGRPLPTVTWGFDNTEAPDSDFQIGQRLAEQAHVEYRLFRIDVDALPQNAERVVYLTDGLTGHIGNYTDGDAAPRALAQDHDAVIRGDEMFGVGARVPTRALGLPQVGINIGKRLQLLRFLLKRDAAGVVLNDYERQRRTFAQSIDPAAPPNDAKDIMFWRTRYSRVIGSQAPVFRSHLEVVCPLLDREVINLIRYCTPAQREHKHYISQCTQTAFADDFRVPLSSGHSRTSWRDRLPRLGPAQRFLVETLLEPLEAFDQWFDRTAIRAWLGQATAEGKRAGWPAGSGWLRRRTAQAGAFLLRPTFKERVVVNLVTLKLWFHLFG